MAPKIWMHLGLNKIIKYFRVKNDIEKKALVDELDFDLAFIDGDHSHKGVLADYMMTYLKAGQIIFDNPGQVSQLLDDLRAKGHRFLDDPSKMITMITWMGTK